ncbi:MAG: phasin family protein [Eggerthellaceae bacterium]|nr:phasin family protein [Eggerthellaceae bacterium]
MTNIGDGFKNIFLAGIGAMAYTGEKGKEIIDQLVAKGEITLDQGRELNEELQRKASDTTSTIRESALEARMRMMTPEERDAFAAAAAKFAAEQNAQAATVEAEAVVEDVEEAAEEVVDAVEEAVEESADEA